MPRLLRRPVEALGLAGACLPIIGPHEWPADRPAHAAAHRPAKVKALARICAVHGVPEPRHVLQWQDIVRRRETAHPPALWLDLQARRLVAEAAPTPDEGSTA